MPLGLALLVYAVLVTGLSWSQAGYSNADFIAYATIAHQVLSDPAGTINGYWSPLYSWAMAPLLALSIDDLVAGRMVLVAAGFGYVAAVHALLVRFGSAPLVRGAVLTCAVLQASLWATHLLDPDLIGSALFFVTLTLLVDPRVRERWWRGLLAGGMAGLAYLGKSFMLPFFLAFAPVAVVVGARLAGHRGLSPCLRALSWFTLGLLLVAGPWVWLLSVKYGGFTFSTAGAANYDQLGPEHYGSTPLWNPPLAANYILDPHFDSDWSPLGSWQEFRHQLMLVVRNTGRVLERLAGWVLMLGVFASWWGCRARQGHRGAALPPPDRGAVVFALVAVAIYLPGYLLVDVERRYVMPTMGPLLCLAAATFATRLAVLAGPHQLLRGVLLGALFGLQEGRLLVVTAVAHPQSYDHGVQLHLAAGLAAAEFRGSFAASHLELGLGLAYAAGQLPEYLGRPLARTPTELAAELDAAGARYFVQFPFEAGSDLAPAGWLRATERVARTAEFRDQSVPLEVFVPRR